MLIVQQSVGHDLSLLSQKTLELAAATIIDRIRTKKQDTNVAKCNKKKTTTHSLFLCDRLWFIFLVAVELIVHFLNFGSINLATS